MKLAVRGVIHQLQPRVKKKSSGLRGVIVKEIVKLLVIKAQKHQSHRDHLVTAGKIGKGMREQVRGAEGLGSLIDLLVQV